MCDIKFERRNILQWFWSMSSSSIRLEASMRRVYYLSYEPAGRQSTKPTSEKCGTKSITNGTHSAWLGILENFFTREKLSQQQLEASSYYFFSLFSSLLFISISLNTEKSFFLFFSCHLFIQIHIFFYYFFFSSLFTKDVFGKKALVSLSLSLFPHLKYDICTKVLLLFSFFAFPS